MRKYILRYTVILLPALLAYYLAYFLLPPGNIPIQIAQWVLGFFLLLGWGVNSAAAAYHYPRYTISFMLAYVGVSTLLVWGRYHSSFGTTAYTVLDHAAGALTYRPLAMLYQALQDFNIFQELWLIGILTCCCAIGFLCGLIYRQIRPNPYHPTMMGR